MLGSHEFPGSLKGREILFTVLICSCSSTRLHFGVDPSEVKPTILFQCSNIRIYGSGYVFSYGDVGKLSVLGEGYYSVNQCSFVK